MSFLLIVRSGQMVIENIYFVSVKLVFFNLKKEIPRLIARRCGRIWERALTVPPKRNDVLNKGRAFLASSENLRIPTFTHIK